MNVLVIGGGSVRNLKEFPPGCRAGDNANAFLGGFRLWEEAGEPAATLSRLVMRDEKAMKGVVP